MTINVRRVVTGHNDEGKAVVLYDGVADNIVSGRPNQSAVVLWQTSEFPSSNNDSTDVAKVPVKTVNPKGTVFRIVEFGPGVAPRVHRTESVDYGVVLAGEIFMEMDDTVLHFRTGDCFIQRGTVHNWVNRGSEPCRIAFVLVAAEPAKAGGKVLEAMG
jgi:mannose-6-phosphate isomerase-like protein (cupin superfamily)